MDIKKFFNASLALMTLLNGYAFSFFRGFSFAMILTTFFVLFGFLVWSLDTTLAKPHFFIFTIYAIFQTIFVSLNSFHADFSNIVYISLKILIWSLFLAFAGYFFDYFLLVKYMKKIITITFIYLVLQYVLHYFFHVSLPCSFDLGFIKSNYDNYEYTMQATNNIFRPGSLWLEPGYLGYYYNSFLAILLFDKENSSFLFSKNKNTYIIITCLGIIMSGSTGGIGIMLVLILLKFVIKDKKYAMYSLILAIFVGIFIYFFFKLNWIENFKGISPSLDNTIWKLQNLDKVGRIGQSFELLDLLSFKYEAFGVGLGNEMFLTQGIYMNGIVTVIIWLGYFGLGVWLFFFFWVYNTVCKSVLQKVMLFVLYFNGIFASLYFGPHSFIYLLIALYGHSIDKKHCLNYIGE